MKRAEFDTLSPDYEALLRDPVRDRFSATGSAFYHLRKRDLILDFWRGRDTRAMSWLDVGCGRGELLALLGGRFGAVAGCDPSAGMLDSVHGTETRVQPSAETIPFESGRFDFATAVCVYHHVPEDARPALTAEIRRVLKPGGVLCIIEHNPYNPITRRIVSRTPVDRHAVLLKPSETRALLCRAALSVVRRQYFLYFPERVYRDIGALERTLAWLPLGGQYAIFAQA